MSPKNREYRKAVRMAFILVHVMSVSMKGMKCLKVHGFVIALYPGLQGRRLGFLIGVECMPCLACILPFLHLVRVLVYSDVKLWHFQNR